MSKFVASVAGMRVLGWLAKGYIDADACADVLAHYAKPEPKPTTEDVLAGVAAGTYSPTEAAELLAKLGRKHGGGGGKRADTVLGYSATSVVRWMAVTGYGFKDIRNALNNLCPNNGLADGTLRCQMAGAKVTDPKAKGYRGEPAQLTAEQVELIDQAVLA